MKEKVSCWLTFLCYNDAILGREVAASMKSTDELTHEIQEAGDIISYFEHNREEMQINSFSEYLEQWLAKKQVTRAEVVRWSNLNKAYVYQIFSGKKYPSRDKVIALAFGLHLTAQEAQTLLKQAGYRELYPRDPRDALLLFAFSKHMTILEANVLLFDHDIEVLE